MKRYGRFSVAAVVTAAVLFVSACSPGTSSTTSQEPSGELSADAAAIVEKAQSYIDDHTGVVVMPEPAGPDFVPVAGKTIGILSCGQEAPACARMVDGATQGLEALGYTVVVEDGKLTPSGWNTSMSKLVQQRVDGIIKLAEPDNAMPQTMKEAADAGIPVVCAVCSNAEEDAIANPTVANADLDATEQGRAQAWYAIAKANGAVSALMFKNELVTSMKLRTVGMHEVLDGCKDCTVVAEEEVTQSPGFEARLRSLVTSQLQQYKPGQLNIVAATSDSQSLGAIQAIEQSGRADDVSIVSSDCELPSLDSIRKDGPQKMCNNSPLQWLGFAAADLMARVLAGQTPGQVYIPSQIVDLNNNLPAEGEYVADPDYATFYKAQWGMAQS
jgi:ribose transport system substrate-binding protein